MIYNSIYTIFKGGTRQVYLMLSQTHYAIMSTPFFIYLKVCENGKAN